MIDAQAAEDYVRSTLAATGLRGLTEDEIGEFVAVYPQLREELDALYALDLREEHVPIFDPRFAYGVPS